MNLYAMITFYLAVFYKVQLSIYPIKIACGTEQLERIFGRREARLCGGRGRADAFHLWGACLSTRPINDPMIIDDTFMQSLKLVAEHHNVFCI